MLGITRRKVWAVIDVVWPTACIIGLIIGLSACSVFHWPSLSGAKKPTPEVVASPFAFLGWLAAADAFLSLIALVVAAVLRSVRAALLAAVLFGAAIGCGLLLHFIDKYLWVLDVAFWLLVLVLFVVGGKFLWLGRKWSDLHKIADQGRRLVERVVPGGDDGTEPAAPPAIPSAMTG